MPRPPSLTPSPVRVKLRRRFALLIASAASLASASRAQEPSAPVTLPAYVVTDARDLPPAEKWRYTRLGPLEIISSASEGKTRHLVRDFARFCQALELVWPDVQRANARLDVLILCDRGEFAGFNPAPASGTAAAPATLTLRAAGHTAIVLDLQTKMMDPGASASLLPTDAGAEITDSRTADRHRQLFRAYVRLLLSSAQPRAPAWFEEGLAQLLMSMQITDREVTVGELQNPNHTLDPDGRPTPVQDLDFNAVLGRGRMLPMEQLLGTAHDSAEARSTQGNMWSKQAYAFVHWGLYGDQGKHQKEFVTFLARLHRQPLSEELFKRTFQCSYKDMALTLLGYAEATSHRIAGVKAQKGQKLPLAPVFDLRDATESEAARLKGETLLAADQLALARQAMALPYRRGERDPALLAAIGLLELRANEPTAARKFLELAASGKTTNSRALVELARLRLDEALAPAAGPASPLTPTQLAAVLTPLFAARAHPPVTLELYSLIAGAWEQSAVPPEPAHLVVLDEGVKLYPREARFIQRCAVLKLRAGATADAAALIALGLQHADTDELRARFTDLQAKLPAPK